MDAMARGTEDALAPRALLAGTLASSLSGAMIGLLPL
jgi:nucleoside permease NupC